MVRPVCHDPFVRSVFYGPSFVIRAYGPCETRVVRPTCLDSCVPACVLRPWVRPVCETLEL